MKETRTARVRIELPNPDLALLPDMYGEVEIATGGDQDVLAVPSNALIDSGNRQVVLLDLGDGRYEPRDVKPGRTGNGFTEILERRCRRRQGCRQRQFPHRCGEQSSVGTEELLKRLRDGE